MKSTEGTAHHGHRKTAAGRIIICAGTGCVANGAYKIHAAFVQQLEAAGVNVTVELKQEQSLRINQSGCQGFCQMGPLVTLLPLNILYTRVKVEDVAEIVVKSVIEGQLVDRLLYVDPATEKHCRGIDDIPFYQRQQRFVLGECGTIDPENLEEYLQHGGYRAAKKAFNQMTPEQIVQEVTKSGLRGRGGGGFPTGRKWDAARVQPPGKKYVICNADEGDPGAFMNRSVMEGNPHSIIEGMMIAARAIGADECYIYVRTEYPLAVARMKKAVDDARKAGLLGKNVFDSGLDLDIDVMEGAGAFVCGEETAMIASIEGRRGMPSPKPPFPAVSGLWGKPTVINNVETLAHAVRVINDGGENFRKLGTSGSPGTKTFALTGHIANTGLIEVPFGTTLREVVLNIGGGVTDAKGEITTECFKAVQIGGPSGGCLTREHLDLGLDYDSLRGAGAMVGSGGLVVINNQTCMVAMARFFMEFTQRESCGKCVLCREGTKQMLGLLDDIIEGRGTQATLDLLEKLAGAVQKGSLCGLGKTAPNPVLSTLRYFKDEYLAHVHGKSCPADQCRAFRKPEIDQVKCKGCGLCARKCPVEAITGLKKQPHHIDAERCIRCGVCGEVCHFEAVSGVN